MTALITGICGFAGRHLAQHLLDSGEHVFGTYLEPGDRALLGPLERRVGLLQGDVRNPRKMGVVLRKTQPDVIYHLAAQASIAQSFVKPVATVDTNVTGTVGVLEAVKREAPKSRVLFPSSADVYGLVRPKDVPIRETQPLLPRNPYAASKVAAEEVCRQYARTYGLAIVIARSFNHTGPGQAPGFVIPDFAMQIAALERRARGGTLKVGNLKARRDLSDVRDVVRGYRLLARKGKPGEVYHLGSGEAHRIGDFLAMLLKLAKVPIKVVADPARQRPSDLPILVADCSRTRRRTGWRTRIALERTLADTLDYWRTYGQKG
jgi:GDP-4-dehydro-6-deoxy-D-mannose reductase